MEIIYPGEPLLSALSAELLGNLGNRWCKLYSLTESTKGVSILKLCVHKELFHLQKAVWNL